MSQGVRNDPTVEPTEADCWYAAGFIDGEGSISIRAKNHGRYHPGWSPSWAALVEVSQVDPRPLQWLQQRWGGALRQIRRNRTKNERDAWDWIVASKQAYKFLEDVLPMLMVKQEHAQNALRLRDLRTGRGYSLPDGTRNRLTEADLSERRAIYEESRRLVTSRPVWTELPEA